MMHYSDDIIETRSDSMISSGLIQPQSEAADGFRSDFQISNPEFLVAIFGNELDPDHEPLQFAWITQFAEDPSTPPKGGWGGKKWDGTEFPVPEEPPVNTFFSIGLFKAAPEQGSVLVSVKRRKANFSCLPCVILDDVGTKANELEVPPTWLLETSPGNYQAGYVFEEAIKSVGDAEIFMKALLAKENLTDTGGQNITRYARLPVGFNTKGKYGEPFKHRLVEWDPTRRYDWRQLAEYWGLDLEVKKTKSKPQRAASTSLSSDDEVFIPRADTNPVLAALMANQLYKKSLGSGKHDISCPWLEEHTDQLDHGTVYFEPDGAYVRGGFKCHHGHCSGRTIGHLLEFLQVAPAAAMNKPTIRVTGGTLHLQADTAEKLLAEQGDYFQSGGAIVKIVTPPGEETTTKPIRPNGMQSELTRMINWEKFDRREGWVMVDAPTKVSNALLDAVEYRNLPGLLAMARQPYMRGDGSIVATPGYDRVTQIFGVFNAREFSAVSNPSREDAEVALARILQLLDEFSFATREDKAAAVAFFLTASVRSALETAPGFLVNAHAPGSGKSYLQELACLFATEGQPASATFKTDDTEMEKVLIATLLETPAVIRFDESTSDIFPVKTLLSMLSSQYVKGRVLGFSKMVTPSTRTLVTFAGNNIQPIKDMVRRVLVIGLDVQSENPESREFKADPVSHLSRNRAAYVMDALTIIRAHIVAHAEAPQCRALNGYTRWEKWVRHAVIWMELGDPCAPMFSKAIEDPYREQLGVLLAELRNLYGSSPRRVRQLIETAKTHDGLRDMLAEIAPDRSGGIDNNRLGHYLKANQGRIVNGYRLVKDTSAKLDTAAYRVEVVSSREDIHGLPKIED